MTRKSEPPFIFNINTMNQTPRECQTAGIDVSSKTLDVFLMDKEEKGKYKRFQNNKKGIRELIEYFRKNNLDGKIVMESTGRYHELVAVTLFAESFDVYVINPLHAKKYHTSQIRKLKTDKNDAKILAEMALKDKKLNKFTLTKSDMHIKRKIGFVRSLEKKIQELNGVLRNFKAGQQDLGGEIAIHEENIQTLVKNIEKEKKYIEADIIEKVFQSDAPEAIEAKRILESISGISLYYAAIIYFYYSKTLGKKAKSWIAYTGLEVSIKESGQSKGKGKLSKRGNKYLRKKSFNAGWGAYMHNPAFKEYYSRLKEMGRSHVEALVIIGRKVLRIAFYCLKNNQLFNPDILMNQMTEK